VSKRNIVLSVVTLVLIAGLTPLFGVGDPVPSIGDETSPPACEFCEATGQPTGEITVKCKLATLSYQSGDMGCRVNGGSCKYSGDPCVLIVVRG